MFLKHAPAGTLAKPVTAKNSVYRHHLPRHGQPGHRNITVGILARQRDPKLNLKQSSQSPRGSQNDSMNSDNQTAFKITDFGDFEACSGGETENLRSKFMAVHVQNKVE